PSRGQLVLHSRELLLSLQKATSRLVPLLLGNDRVTGQSVEVLRPLSLDCCLLISIGHQCLLCSVGRDDELQTKRFLAIRSLDQGRFKWVRTDSARFAIFGMERRGTLRERGSSIGTARKWSRL